MTHLLVDIARATKAIIRGLEADGWTVNDDNVIALLALNTPGDIALNDLSSALVVAGLAGRFPRATAVRL